MLWYRDYQPAQFPTRYRAIPNRDPTRSYTHRTGTVLSQYHPSSILYHGVPYRPGSDVLPTSVYIPSLVPSRSYCTLLAIYIEPGFYLCATCKASLPVEDKQGRCSSCLGPEHAKEALMNRSFSLFLITLCYRGGFILPHDSMQKAVLTVFLILLCPPSTPLRKRKKSHWSKQLVDSEQMEKLWAVVSHQGTVLAELLRERSAPPALPVPLGSQGAMSADWQQDEDMESDSTSVAVKPSLSADLCH
ncbi:UNVERIFIED_CONTAM: hypothetical protein FKN15_074842 [Acipenser sinensis]